MLQMVDDNIGMASEAHPLHERRLHSGKPPREIPQEPLSVAAPAGALAERRSGAVLRQFVVHERL